MIVTFESSSQNENWTPRELANLIGKRQSSGDDAKYLIAPTPIESDTNDASNRSCTTAGTPKKPKNHLRANRQALREKQHNNKGAALARQAQETLQLQKLKEKKQRLYGKISSRAFSPAASSSLPLPLAGTHASSASRASSLLEDSSSNGSTCEIAFGRKIPISDPLDRPTASAGSVASSSTRHKSFGKTPAYITNRKAKIEREEEEQRRVQEMAPPAPGLELMEESERLETLRILEENEKAAWKALRNIPFSIDEKKAARRREAIEFQLKEIEDSRKIFSKDRVFVKQNIDD